MKARNLMSTPAATVRATDELAAAATLMRERSVGMLPVVSDRGDLVGVITDRDITVRCVARHHFGGCSVRDHMTRVPLTIVTPDDSAEAVLELMDRARVRRLPVVGEDGAVLGVIAQADLVRKLYDEKPGGVVEVLRHISQPA